MDRPSYNSNIWFFMMSSSPDGHIHKDTIEVSLAQEDGKWFGKKSGETFKMDVYFKKQIRFPKAGVYTFEIAQGMRDKELKGIHRIGFKLLQAD